MDWTLARNQCCFTSQNIERFLNKTTDYRSNKKRVFKVDLVC